MVGTLAAAVARLVHTERELTVTDVGAGSCGPDHAQAGLQRMDQVLHSGGWHARLIGEVRWEHAESEQIVGQSSVRSRRARSAQPTRTHVFTQVQVPIRVSGLEEEHVLLVGTRGIPVRVDMCGRQRHAGAAGQPFPLQEAMVIRASNALGQAGLAQL